MTKSTKEFLNPKTLMAPAGYTHIARASGGTTIYIAGQVSSDEAGKLIGENNFEAQAEQVFRNLKIAVEAAGGTMADLVKMNVYLVAEVARTTYRNSARSAIAMSTSRIRRPLRWSW